MTLRALAGVGLTLLVLVGCRGDGVEDPLPGSVEVGVSPTPPVVGPALLVIRIDDEAGSPVEGAEVEVEGTMNHAGMVPVHATAEAAAPGEYRVEAFEFTMGGEWILWVRITLPDGTTGTHRETLRVASSPPPGSER
jgi:hypothetical protein